MQLVLLVHGRSYLSRDAFQIIAVIGKLHVLVALLGLTYLQHSPVLPTGHLMRHSL